MILIINQELFNMRLFLNQPTLTDNISRAQSPQEPHTAPVRSSAVVNPLFPQQLPGWIEIIARLYLDSWNLSYRAILNDEFFMLQAKIVYAPSHLER